MVKISSQRPRSPTPVSSQGVQPALSLPVELHALSFWVENFQFRLDDLPGMGHEYGSYVLLHWARARPDSSLHLALLALSHAVFGRIRQVDEATIGAYKFYARSIVKLSKETKELSSENMDQLLLTTMLMANYEVRA
jgi:hypothetical protein